MKHFIILVLLFFTKTIFAQSFSSTATTLAEIAPICNTTTEPNNAKISNIYTEYLQDNNKWIKHGYMGFEGDQYIDEHKVIGDTLIGGILYKKVSYINKYILNGPLSGGSGEWVINNSGGIYLSREDVLNKKIYQQVISGDILEYDFDLIVGDSMFHFNTFLGLVDSITYETMLDGNNYKCFWANLGTYKLIEGIGLENTNEVFFDEKISCFYKNDEIVFNNSLICDTLYNNISETDYYPITMRPNPTASSFIIENISDIKTVLVYDVTGKEMQTIRIKNTIDISNLAAGFYIVKCTDKNDKIFVGKIIKE